MSRWQQDAVDFACEAWAWQWVALFARDPTKAREYLGRLASTLDLVKVMGDGAGARGTAVTQVFPEGFLGDGLVVACVMKYMRDTDRETLWRHYVDRWYYQRQAPVKTADGRVIYGHTRLVMNMDPESGKSTLVREVDRSRPDTYLVVERRIRPMKQQTMAQRMGVSRAEYHSRRDVMKSFVRGALMGQKRLDSKVGAREPDLEAPFARSG